MDIDLQKKVNEVIAHLQKISADDINYQLMDPVGRMMLVALIYETQKLQDYIDGVIRRVTDRYCEDFIPRQEVDAMPALTVVAPTPKRETDVVTLGPDTQFHYRTPACREPLTYIPLFAHSIFPYADIYNLTCRRLLSLRNNRRVAIPQRHRIWLGISSMAEVESLRGLSIYIRGLVGIEPVSIHVVGNTARQLEFASMTRLEDIDMLEPFDAQQSSGKFFSLMRYFKTQLVEKCQGTLLTITDAFSDRDTFKGRSYPKVFQQWLESDVLDCFQPNTIWLAIDYPEGFIVPDGVEVTINAVPVVNIDVCSTTLTQAAPIAKLQHGDSSFYIGLVETSSAANRQGFSMNADEIVIRDFDAACYNNGDLYRDVRNMYNHFVEDYYAFVEYNGLKDGEDIKKLKELINKIGKSVGTQNSRYKFDSGVYAMKNINQYPPTSSTRVTYITTQGTMGNAPQRGEVMDNKTVPSLVPQFQVIAPATGGKDKATPDQRYELLRYYALTHDRLFTKMDIDAFVRKELIARFGRTEFRRINVKLNVQGMAGRTSVQRGLYIDIEFRDRKNYDRATAESLGRQLLQLISNRSCISMPISVSLVNLDKQNG